MTRVMRETVCVALLLFVCLMMMFHVCNNVCIKQLHD